MSLVKIMYNSGLMAETYGAPSCNENGSDRQVRVSTWAVRLFKQCDVH